MLPVPIDGAQWPSSGVTSYGYQRTPSHKHQGVDFAAPLGTPIRSVFAGVVELAAPPGARGFDGYGRALVVRRADGVRAMYAHLESSLVSQGDTVAEGQPIATVGTSRGTVAEPGRQFARSRAHLHLEFARSPYPLRKNHARLNPLEVEPMADDQRDSIERWHALNKLIVKLYNAVPENRRSEAQPMLDAWREAYAAAPSWGPGLRASAISTWIERYNAARKALADRGLAVPQQARDVGVHVDAAEAVETVVDTAKDVASAAGSWIVLAALAYLWLQTRQREEVVRIEVAQ